MKKLISFLLASLLLLNGCGVNKSDADGVNPSEEFHVRSDLGDRDTSIEIEGDITEPWLDKKESLSDMKSLSDPELLQYVEERVYSELVDQFKSDDYFIENISTSYISKEYLEELAYNSQSNIYFGYTLEELQEQFEGVKYVFTLGDDGQTVVQEFEEYVDNTFGQVVENVVIGTGVILVCVTVSAVSGGAAPAVSMIFAVSAKTGAAVALSSGVISGVTAGFVTGMKTKDFEQALNAAVLEGSEDFKWGAITGAISGGMGEFSALKGVTLNGLKMDEAARIQRESSLPLEFIKSFHSVEEYNVYKNSGLQLTKVNGKWAYIQNIDWNYIGTDGRSNAKRVADGASPLDPTGKPYELHHIGQKTDSPLAILTNSVHHKNHKILHKNTGSSPSEVDRNSAWKKQKKEFWKSLLEMSQGEIK